MGDVNRAEMVLAEAVVHLAIKEVLHGTPARKEQALIDIASGSLDFWIEIVCSEGYSCDTLLAVVRALA